MTLEQQAPPVVRERVPVRARRGPNRTATAASRASAAYVLSAVAAAIQLVAAFAIARGGYGFVPLVLPLLGLAWLGRTPT